MGENVRSKFDDELEVLNEEILKMGMLVEVSVEKAVGLISKQDVKKAKEVYEHEEEIDNMEHKIQTHCLRLLIEQQPVAKDLRRISAALKIITDMERIGDQARDIAEICMHYEDGNEFGDTGHIIEMGRNTIYMVKNTVKAFVDNDVVLAREVSKYDDVVDNYFITVRDDLIKLIREEKVEPDFIVDLLMISKYLERIADHAVNISEWVIFTVEG